MSLHCFKADFFSQNGEDGIIEVIFKQIGIRYRTCCEFGAWDGVYLSNCRKLILEGWRALMIEGNRERYNQLSENYRDNPKVVAVNCFVDGVKNNLGRIVGEYGFKDLDFLSVDIDGLDFEVFEGLNIRPRVICIEVNAGHSPDATKRISRDTAQKNVGQPLSLFIAQASKNGYDLVCFNANAFFVKTELRKQSGLKKLSAQEAYAQYLENLDEQAKEWMYLVNLGLVCPFYKFSNCLLGRKSLGIGLPHAIRLWLRASKSMLSVFLRCLKN